MMGCPVSEHAHAGAAVVVVFIHIGNFLSENVRRIEIVDFGLDIIIEDEDPLIVGHKDPLIEIDQQFDEVDLIKIESVYQKIGDRIALKVSHRCHNSNI